MKTTLEYLNAVKATSSAVSDYELAKKLNTTKQAISLYRNGQRKFDDLMCVKVAQILEIDPLLVISCINAERSNDDEVKAVWKSLFEKLGGVAASLLLASAVLLQPAPAQASSDFNYAKDVYYVK